jgi:16S rRNA (guanine966-N2)-methyltransferase
MKRKPKAKTAKPKAAGSKSPAGRAQVDPVGMRIIGGKFRGRRLQYSGDLGVRPMKDRVREALFNLVGVEAKGTHAIDLFGGTGALGLEAISRGALRATFVERHFPTAAVLRANIETLGLTQSAEVLTSDTFIWWRTAPALGSEPWTIFCSPPYDYFMERTDDMLGLIGSMLQAAPPGSVAAVESDLRFDAGRLPEGYDWDVRTYPPAQVAIGRKGR